MFAEKWISPPNSKGGAFSLNPKDIEAKFCIKGTNYSWSIGFYVVFVIVMDNSFN